MGRISDHSDCKNVETLVNTFNSLDSWIPDENQTPKEKSEEF